MTTIQKIKSAVQTLPKQEKIAYVAYFDILGFGSILENNSFIAYRTLLNLKESVDEQRGLPISQAKRDKIDEKYFSDTVIFVSEDDGEISLLAVIVRSIEIFEAASMRNIPLRGGIAHGEWFQSEDKSVFTGTALKEAYEIGESQQMLGIRISDSVYSKIFENRVDDFFSHENITIKYNVPLKSNKTKKCYVLNWPAFFILLKNPLKPELITNAEFLYTQFFQSAIGVNFTDLPNEAKCKYKNTIKFLNFIKEKELL